MIKKLKNTLATLVLLGVSALYANSQDSAKTRAQEFLDYTSKRNKEDTLYHKGPIEFEYGKSGTETEEIFALDRNNDRINDGVIKIVTRKESKKEKTIIYYIWTASNGDSLFDKYETRMEIVKDKGKGKKDTTEIMEPYVSTDTTEINQFLPFFDGKPFDWFNGK